MEPGNARPGQDANIPQVLQLNEELNKLFSHYKDELPRDFVTRYQSIHNKINEACGWNAETAKAAGVGGGART